MENYEIEKDGYTISTDNAKIDVDVVHQYLSKKSYWAQNIPKEIVAKSIANALCFGMFYNGIQIGFARVITDRATFAYLGDVFILEAHRGKGLSKWLVQVIHAHPDLQGLRAWVLRTRDAHTLYEQFGWQRLDETAKEGFMQIRNPDVYANLKIS